MIAPTQPKEWKALRKITGTLNGPHHVWEVIDQDDNGVCMVVTPAIRGAYKYFDERAATARLIAAAPELLAALENLLRWADPFESPDACRRARDAIAKAKQANF